MIATVLGPLDAGNITGNCCSREELLHKASPAVMKALHDNPITLANLAEIRGSGDSGRLAASNRLFSLDESVQELASLKDAGGLVLECSAVGDGRDPSGLAEISRRSGVAVVMAASAKEKEETESAAPPPSPESIGKGLEHQLLFGEHGNDSYSHSAPSAAPPTTTTAPAGGAASRVQAGFILVKLYCGNSSCSYQPGATTATGTPTAESALLASGDSISDRIAGGTAMVLEGAVKAQLATGAPLMLAFSHFVRWPRVESALAIVAAHWGDTPDAGASRSSRQVIVAGMHGGVSQSLPDHAALLNKGVVLCFDCFGRVEWSAGSDYYPSDEESAVRIAELVRQGFAGQIVISSGVSRRIHLSRFGGHGYGHALRTVPPRLLRLGVSVEDVTLMTRATTLRLLDWYTPPPPMEIPKDYLPCSWCQKRFEPVEGEYFHKFQFVYCGIKCLRGHRDTGFDADAVAKGAA